MSEIYVTGHRNPDLDSISAAWCYARLKNIVDPHNTYIPVRCGHMNETTKDQFTRLGIPPVRFMRDVRPKVADVVTRDGSRLGPEEPVHRLIEFFGSRHASVIPLLSGEEYVGLLSLDEITAFFLRENAGARPRYVFKPGNFAEVIKGEFVKRAQTERFEAYIMTGAMEFDVYCSRLEALAPDLPVLVVGNRKRHIQYAVDKQFPAIILTGMEQGVLPEVDFSSYLGTVYRSYHDTAETIRLLRMCLPVRYLLGKTPPSVNLGDLFDDAKRLLVESEYRGLPVFEEGKYVGFVTRRCFLERPRKKVIMVDHNELSQSIDGLEDADVVEIIDHHRLGAEKTRGPIFIASEPVGSTCTIVYHQFLRWGVPVDPLTAAMLLSGIAADTVLLKSPTTTDMDRSAVRALCTSASIPDFDQFGRQLFSSASVLTNADPKRVVESDFKIYREFGVRFGIGQVEVTTLANVDEVKERFLVQLEATRQKNGLDWAMLMITDVVREESILLATPFAARERALVYPMVGEGKFMLTGVLSRKKQLLPEILRVLEEGR